MRTSTIDLRGVVSADGRVDAVALYERAFESGELLDAFGDAMFPEVEAHLDAIRAYCEPGDHECQQRLNSLTERILDYGRQACHDGIRFGAKLHAA